MMIWTPDLPTDEIGNRLFCSLVYDAGLPYPVALDQPRVESRFRVRPIPLVDAVGASFLVNRVSRSHCLAAEKCESPIESAFYWAVLAIGGAVAPQVRIGRYRVDFLLRRNVVVECDGHEWHERTKQQAAKDAARTRYLVSRGLRVLRFTGSELYRSPAKCAVEALTLVVNS